MTETRNIPSGARASQAHLAAPAHTATTAEEQNAVERPARFPFPFAPSGWYQLAQQPDIMTGSVTPMHYLGRDLVLWRTELGEIRAAEAFCPHLGAHLGYGGTIEGELLTCPFHGWRFDTSGVNVQIPYSDRTNLKAHLTCIPVAVANGVVFAWHGSRGEPPGWEVPVLDESLDRSFVRVAGERVLIRSHVQELLENVVDVAHFQFVHHTAGFGSVELVEQGPMLRSTAGVVFVTPKGNVDGSVVSELWGLGIDIVRPKGILHAAVIFAVTPVKDGLVEAGYTFFVPKKHGTNEPTNLGRAMMADFSKQLEQDIPIWEHKAYKPSPALARGDGPIVAFRRWAYQFYGD
ncbi:MAG: aromatic ring-hydroxylating dioxygenase subunit alpha [Actinobacteria bacterium]|nr:aromatic ring-hydroxylating dioxygenase subunit alpha [Actinomycetota bacterium]